MSEEYDVIVIGSGAGGGMLAWSLARRGRKVLMIERGKRFSDRESSQDERRMLIDMEPFDDRRFDVNGRDARLYIGGILGGGTSLFGAALLRPSREDFNPGRWYGDRIPKEIHRWPIGYDALEPYYTAAEDILGVSGVNDVIPPHIESPTAGYFHSVPELEPINQRLKAGIERSGYTPFHLPLGIDFNRCARCPTCPGYLCPNNARASGPARLFSDPAVLASLEIRTETEAIELISGRNGRAEGIRIRDRRTGSEETARARVCVLAAGAIGSPVILMRSGYNDISGQLGRNYAYHCGALAAGIFPGPTGGSERFIKQLGFTDLYFGTEEFRHKLGYVQTLPVPGPLSVIENAPFPLPLATARFLNKRMLIISGAVEDLPLPENRVELGRDGRIRLRHRFHAYDIERSGWYLGRLKRVMRNAGALLCLGGTGDKDDVHTAHQVGTARFGTDPTSSVLDPDCRLHGMGNVYVVDGSFMPTSLGVGPALTIMANGLRVADIIHAGL